MAPPSQNPPSDTLTARPRIVSAPPRQEGTKLYQYDLKGGGFLIRLDERGPGDRIPIAKKVIKIGRSAACDVVLTDPEVSLTHAEIVREGDSFVLRDTGSKNGVVVRNQLVSELPLNDGDEFRICRSHFRFVRGEEPPTGEVLLDRAEHTEVGKAPVKARKRRQRLWIAGAAVAAAVIALVVMRAWSSLPQVVVTPVTREPLQQVTTFNGRLVPKSDVRVFPTVSAPVVKILAKEGQLVRKGDPILALDPEILSMSFEKAKADVSASVAAVHAADSAAKIAERKYREDQALARKGILSRAEVDARSAALNGRRSEASSARANQRLAETRLAQAKRDSGDTVVRSPIDGQVTTINIKVGETPQDLRGVPLATIEDSSELLAEVTANEAKVGLIKVGQVAKLYMSGAGLGTEFFGKVTQVAPKAQASGSEVGNTVYTAKVSLDRQDERLRAGMQVQVRIITAEKLALSVPLAAVVTGGHAAQGAFEQLAIVDAASLVRWVPVETDLITADKVEITTGPPVGSLVIVGPVDVLLKLKDGDRVRTTTGR